MHRFLSLFAVTLVLVLFGVTNSSAQENAARHRFGVTTGDVNFDLSGSGNTWGVGLRGARALTPHVAVEVSTLFAWPDLQGGRALLLVPEVHLQYHWRFGRFAPFAGGGIGFAHQSRDGSESANNLALSTAGGLRAYLNDRVALLGEFRLRGIQRDFAASTAEIMGGLSFDIGR